MSTRQLQKIILYYKFVPVVDPATTVRWQKELCSRLNLRGRIIISPHGINGTLGGSLNDLKAYKKEMQLSKTFAGIEYKWSDGSRDDFPRLSVKARPELVTLAPGEEFDVFNSSQGLRPKKWHEYIEAHPDAIIFDARNVYESGVGRFKNAIAPPIKNFRDVKEHLEQLPKDKPILTYCTGDIRCEYLSAYMRHKGFGEVYHLDGGVAKYGEEFKDDGLWEGELYVFDKRRSIAFSDKKKDIGVCELCKGKTSNVIDCTDEQCPEQHVVCASCAPNFVHAAA